MVFSHNLYFRFSRIYNYADKLYIQNHVWTSAGLSPTLDQDIHRYVKLSLENLQYGESTSAPGNLIQCCTTLLVSNFFSQPELPERHMWPLHFLLLFNISEMSCLYCLHNPTPPQAHTPPTLYKSKQVQLPQRLLLGSVSHAPHHHGKSPLDPFQFLSVPLEKLSLTSSVFYQKEYICRKKYPFIGWQCFGTYF